MRSDGGCGRTARACSVSFIIGLLFAKCFVLQTEVFDDNICHQPGRVCVVKSFMLIDVF